MNSVQSFDLSLFYFIKINKNPAILFANSAALLMFLDSRPLGDRREKRKDETERGQTDKRLQNSVCALHPQAEKEKVAES